MSVVISEVSPKTRDIVKDELISSSRLLQEKISDDFKISVGSKFVRNVMKREMKLVYHRSRKV